MLKPTESAALLKRGKVAVVLTVLNEEKGIGRILNFIDQQSSLIDDVVVVSDGSTDNTGEIVYDWIKRVHDFKIVFIRMAIRQGRATAIKVGLSQTQNDLAVILSGDIKPEKDSLENLLSYFENSGVGLVTGKAVLLNSRRTIADCLNHIIWESHNKVREELSKRGKVIHASGDMVAVRKIALKGFEKYGGVIEDAAMGLIAIQNGFKALFASDVNYRVFLPSTVGDYVRTRRRCCYGRVELSKTFGFKCTFYEFSTREYVVNIVKATHFKAKNLLSLCFGVPLEIFLRLYYTHKHVNDAFKELWPASKSTKW